MKLFALAALVAALGGCATLPTCDRGVVDIQIRVCPIN